MQLEDNVTIYNEWESQNKRLPLRFLGSFACKVLFVLHRFPLEETEA